MKWYVLKVGFVVVLLAVLLDVLDVYLGGFQHPLITRPVIYLSLAALALAAGFDFVVEQNHRSTISSFSPLLNGGEKSEISQGWDGTTLVTAIAGQCRGRQMTAKMWGCYSQRSPLTSLSIMLACNWPWAFQIERRTIGVQMMEAVSEIPTSIGEPEFDAELAVSADDRFALRQWLSRPETGQLVRRLTVEHHGNLATVAVPFASVPSLECRYSPYHGYYRSYLPAVLEILSALAASLEGKAESAAHC